MFCRNTHTGEVGLLIDDPRAKNKWDAGFFFLVKEDKHRRMWSLVERQHMRDYNYWAPALVEAGYKSGWYYGRIDRDIFLPLDMENE